MLRRLLPLLGSPILAAAPFAALATAQAGVDREAMWDAPTAEDWAKPTLITWQRTFEDAVAVARAEGRPLLIAVNMDGEIASEHYAGVRYRQPEVAALYEPYVCLMASVYRHNPADHDEHGERIECPRFGSVTCGEHIALEPQLHDLFFDGQRIAPRHIGVELTEAGELPGPEAEYYDVFYAMDTDSVFQAVREGSVGRVPENPPARGERNPLDLVASPDIRDRQAVEQAYAEGDTTTRRELLTRSVAAGRQAPVEVLRMAVFGLDADLARIAREALAQTNQAGAADLIAEALRTAVTAEEREALIAALERLSPTDERARNLAVVHRGLEGKGGAIDLGAWGGSNYSADSATPDSNVARVTRRARAASSRPADPEAALGFAEASLQTALDPRTAALLSSASSRGGVPMQQLMLEDARRSLNLAKDLGQVGWRVDAVEALLLYYTGDPEPAYPLAEAAVEAMPGGAPGAADESSSWTAAALMQVFAEARERRIINAVRAKQKWPGEWLSDVDAAYTVLSSRDLDTDFDVQVHHDFLRWLGADERAEIALDRGLARYPESATLHERLRRRALIRGGPAGVQAAYATLLETAPADSRTTWFAGFGNRTAAEYHRRRREPELATAAYSAAIALFERDAAAHPETADSSLHEVALCVAGQARLALESERLDEAADLIARALTLRPASAATLDGLNQSAVMTATTLRARLLEADRADRAAEILEQLQALDPVLLEPPAFEPRTPRRSPR